MVGLLGMPMTFVILSENALFVFFINRIHHFADLYAKKLSVKREVLMKTLWGDFYFDKKTKRVFKGAQVRQ